VVFAVSLALVGFVHLCFSFGHLCSVTSNVVLKVKAVLT